MAGEGKLESVTRIVDPLPVGGNDIGTVRTAKILNNNGSFAQGQADHQLAIARVVSATDAAQVVTLELANLHRVLAIHSAASAGTAALKIEASVDNTNFLTLDDIAAAATQVKQYEPSTVGAGIALSPLAFRFVKITAGAAGVGNTTTLTVAVK